MSIHLIPTMSLPRRSSVCTLDHVRVSRRVLPSSIRPNLFSGD